MICRRRHDADALHSLIMLLMIHYAFAAFDITIVQLMMMMGLLRHY